MSILPPGLALRRGIGKLIDYMLPGSCLLCGCGCRALLCTACLEDFPQLPEAQCPQCGERNISGEHCAGCLRDPPKFQRTVALYRYEFPVDRLIQQLKYKHQLAIARWAGEALASKFDPRAIDLILPVPLHTDRLRQRGFNQSGEITRALGQVLGRPVTYDALVRHDPTLPQASLSHDERQSNVHGVFECHEDLTGRHILLIDDVMTTGATLRECARVLRLHGAASIEVGVIARALRNAT